MKRNISSTYHQPESGILSPDYFLQPEPFFPSSIDEAPEIMLDKNDCELQNRKDHKNKFINKIKKLQSGQLEGSQHICPQLRETSLSERPITRKQRNKLAAQGSRDRKKMYIKLMQFNIDRLQSEIEAVNRDIQHKKEDIYSLQLSCQNQGRAVRQKYSRVVKKMRKLLEEQDEENRQNELNICIDSVLYRMGVSGHQKKVALTKFYQDLLNFSQPAFDRFMMWTAVRKTHLFGPNQQKFEEQWLKQLQQINEQALNYLKHKGQNMQKRGQEISKLNQDFKKSSESLAIIRRRLEKKAQQLEHVFNQIRDMLAPEQAAELILFVEKYEFKNQICLFDKNTLEYETFPRKKVKISQENL